MVSTSGHTLLESEAISTLKEFLMPLATLITPNLPEGCILAGRERATNHDLSESESMFCSESQSCQCLMQNYIQPKTFAERLQSRDLLMCS